ncbi:MAG TPA: chalcone isomerase family protein [Burkholderiales bacterium]|nr:chalcone isomerase family protein [Burkholderiales bacterium]
MKKASLCALLVIAAFAATAAELAGVKLEDKTQVESRELVLNGAGLRKRVFFNVYVIGLYLPEKKSDPAAVLALAGPKRAEIHMLRDVGADTFTEALVEGLRKNTSDAEYQALEPRVQQLSAAMAELREAKKGMTISLDWTGSATQLVVNGKSAGRPIAGEDFYRALLRIWLGDKPVQDDLKKSLLGV